MSNDQPSTSEQTSEVKRETVSVAALDRSENVTEVARPAAEERPRTTIGDLARTLPSVSLPPPPKSWIEWAGARMAMMVLGLISVLVLLFVGIWWGTRPTLAEVAASVGQSTPAQLVEAFNQARQAHNLWVKDIFQLVVVSTLVPIFTLLAGYAFGSQQRGDKSNDSNEK